MRLRNVLMLKPGEAAAPICLDVGDYDRWFLDTLGDGLVRFHVVRPYLGEELPGNPGGHDAVIVTGAPLSATAPAGWMRRTAEYLLECAERRVPVLGICFGHQLLGMALGVAVVRNPAGREIGTVEVSLTEAGRQDPLFEGVPATFHVQATHEDIVPEVPAGATLLGANRAAAVQALAMGKYLRGVQFHPELSAEGMRSVIRSREEIVDQEGAAQGEAHRARALLEAVRPSPYGRRILENFLTRF